MSTNCIPRLDGQSCSILIVLLLRSSTYLTTELTMLITFFISRDLIHPHAFAAFLYIVHDSSTCAREEKDKMVSVAKDFTIKDLRGLFIEANLLDKRSIIGAKQSYDIGKEKVHLSFTVEVIGDSDIYLTISNLSTFNVRLGGRLNIIQRMEASSISDRILLRLGKFQVNNGLTT